MFTTVLDGISRAVLLAAICLALAGGEAAAESPDYSKQIKPLLAERCLRCHGQLKQEGGLRLDAGKLIHRGGDEGKAIAPGDSSKSPMIERVLSRDKDKQMPPEGERLAGAQVELLRRWIDAGAIYPADEVVSKSPAEHWAFQPVRRPPIPAIRNRDWARNPLDAFVLARLEQQGLSPPPEAAPAALLRRIYLDLTGMPPTLDEQERFARDGDLDRVIDDLLARPAYGERWARHWLDVVRYADSNGYERDAEKPFVWRYRDYVIRSLSRDKPFDRMVLEQIAGDELADRSLDSQIAAGFLRLGHWDDEPADPATDRYDQLDDIVSTTGLAFLGLSIGCARCHDHKFEPLTSRDYYGLVAVFSPLERPVNGRTELTVPYEGAETYTWREPSGKPPETRVLIRGSPARPGAVAVPAVPAVLVRTQPSFPPGETTTRRRLGLAQWLASPQNPLTARVIVNRVWQQHFGRGLVSTASDFGLGGAAPSQAELLDYLADWFMHDADWSLKKLHRLILTSSAHRAAAGAPNSPVRYRRLEVEAIRDSMLAVSGGLNPKPFGPPMKPAIPPAALEANSDQTKVWQVSSEAERSRRSIYAFVKRSLIVPMFESLDLADTVSSCPQRQVTTVAPQALILFNGEFVQEQARRFAARLDREAPGDPQGQIRLAYRLALCREPTPPETAAMQTFLQQQKQQPLEQLCRVVLNLNEFVYPE